jgi:hypothetical protein
MIFQENRSNKMSFCLKVMAIFSFTTSLLYAPTTAAPLKKYRYYNTREDYYVGPRPNKFRSYKEHTEAEIANAWIKVPWTHGGHYYHNTLTREDKDRLD